MTKEEEFFIEFTKQFPTAKLGRMYGALCIRMPNKKTAAILCGQCIVVKLPTDKFQEAVNLPGAGLFESIAGKPMKEWVQIPFLYNHRWKEFAEISTQRAATITPSNRRK
jgi:hypothetical protein